MIALALLVALYWIVVLTDETGRTRLRERQRRQAEAAADRYFARRGQ